MENSLLVIFDEIWSMTLYLVLDFRANLKFFLKTNFDLKLFTHTT